MMMFKGGGMFGILALVFFTWVFIASADQERLERGCRPVQWLGSFVESITDLTVPKYSPTVDGWIDSAEYGCQYMVWRLFYEDAWVLDQTKKAQEKEIIDATPKGDKKHHD